jgi:hypothetical protein
MGLSWYYDPCRKFDKLTRVTFLDFFYFFLILSFNIGLIEN